MQFETLRSRLPMLLALPAGALALSGCLPNYSGNGNEFVVHGKVVHPGNHSITAQIFEVDEANGQANGWFKLDTVHQLHDNCNCHGALNLNKRYGTVYDMAGHSISPSSVAVGDCIQFDGKIRADQEGKISYDRPVFDVAQEEKC